MFWHQDDRHISSKVPKDSSVDHVESCHQRNEGIRYLSLQLTIDGKEGVVDGDDGGVGMVEGGAHDEAADAAESVDTDLDGHGCFRGLISVGCGLLASAGRMKWKRSL